MNSSTDFQESKNIIENKEIQNSETEGKMQLADIRELIDHAEAIVFDIAII